MTPRVVSLLPSATEVLAAIGGADLLVGRSHECDFPPSLRPLPVLTAPRITSESSAEIDAEVRAALHGSDDPSASLYHLDVDALIALRPDVILTQDLCHVCSIDLGTVRRAAASMPSPPTIVSLNPVRLEDVFDDLLRVGEAVGRAHEADDAMVRLRARYWEAIDCVNPYLDGPSVAFLEWTDPLFCGGHWTPQLITAAGGRHPLNAAGEPSRQITPKELVDSQPDRVIVCPCGFDLDATRRAFEALRTQPWWPELPAVQSGHVMLVDGNQMFNRPGPRLIDAFEWLTAWLTDRPENPSAAVPFERVPPAPGRATYPIPEER